MVVLGGVSYANNVYNQNFTSKGYLDIKPLLFAGISALLLEGFAQIPGMRPAATLLGWTAFVGMLIGPVQKPSPMDNLLKIGQVK